LLIPHQGTVPAIAITVQYIKAGYSWHDFLSTQADSKRHLILLFKDVPFFFLCFSSNACFPVYEFANLSLLYPKAVFFMSAFPFILLRFTMSIMRVSQSNTS